MKSSIRGLSSFVIGAAFVAFALLVPNCQPTGGEQTGATGGSSGSGGSGSGGNGSGGNGSGGNGSGGNGSGGSTSKGGSGGSNSGGTTSKGGSGGSNSGGTTSKGGSGGTPGSGGSTSPGSGGTTTTTTVVTGTGGTTSTSTSTGNTGTIVVFGNGKGQGAMTGYGWVSLGTADSLTDPLCGTTPITSTTTCASTTWSKTDALCMTGSIPALAAKDPDYSGNWGVQVGVNSTEPAGGGLGQSFSSVAITVTGTPTTGLRATVHRKDDAVGAGYCAAMTSGTAITFTTFNTKCYDTPPDGTALTAADVTNIDQIGVQVSSTTSEITVANLCMTKIEFAK